MFIETQYFQGFFPPHELKLASGETLGPITLAYETYGSLNTDASNAILVCHALSGNARLAHRSAENPDQLGWWDSYVGKGKAIDTDRFFVICINTIGGCSGSTGPSSIDPKTQQPYRLTFPVITIFDMVRSQKALIDHFGIQQLYAVVGGSMGGMQALEWAIQYPELVTRCIPIASTYSLPPQAMAFDAVGRHAITSDEIWKKGQYDSEDSDQMKGLSIARMIGHITYLSDESLKAKFGRKLQEKNDYGYNFDTEFQIESYLKYQGDKFVSRFDANSYLYLTKALSYFDLEKSYGSLENAFQNCRSRFLLIAISSDWIYPPEQSRKIVDVLIGLDKEVAYCQIESSVGHDAFLIHNEVLIGTINGFLES